MTLRGRNKYDLRYRSRKSRRADKKNLRHEHVFTRKKFVDELLKHPDKVDEIVANAVGCVVTKSEHEKLLKVDKKHPDAIGWQRYELAKIDVIDMTTGEPRKS